MKNGKVPTRKRKDLIRSCGLDPEEYLVVKNTSEYLEIVSRTDLEKQKISGKKARTRKLYKDQEG